MSASKTARPPNRAARDLLPRSMRADRSRRSESCGGWRRAAGGVGANCSTFVTVSVASVRQACYPPPLVTGGRTSLRVLRRQVALSALLIGLPLAALFGFPHLVRTPIRSARSARRHRACWRGCSNSMPPHRRRTAATRRRVESCGLSSTSFGSTTRRSASPRQSRPGQAHAREAARRHLHVGGPAVLARGAPRRSRASTT